jgi:DNA-binding transcriptional regulator YdaS (Cro superfamily)
MHCFSYAQISRYHPAMDKYARALKDAMESSAVRTSDLARKVGVIDAYVSQWRSGRRPVPVERASKVGEVLNVPPERISEAYDRLLRSGCIVREGLSAGTIPKDHVALDRLPGFDYGDWPSFLLMPEFFIRQKIGLTPMEDVRWTLQPTDAMAPQIPRDTMVLIDVRVSSQSRVIDGGMHAFTLYDRPHIRRILPRRDNWVLCGYDDERDRILVPEADLPKLDIRGLVVAWL